MYLRADDDAYSMALCVVVIVSVVVSQIASGLVCLRHSVEGEGELVVDCGVQ